MFGSRPRPKKCLRNNAGRPFALRRRFCAQIGSWNEDAGIVVVKNRSMQEVAGTLKNKLLVVTTLLVSDGPVTCSVHITRVHGP